MNLLSKIVSRSLEPVPGTWDFAFPDAGALAPFAALCLTSLLCTTLWFWAVSRYVARHRIPVVR